MLKVSYLEVDRDLHFPPTKAKDAEKIRIAQGWFNQKVRPIAVINHNLT